MPSGRVLRDELEAIRKGRGVQEPQVRNRMGPVLRRLCVVDRNTSHSDARRSLVALLADASDQLPSELKLAARVMFAIEDQYELRFLRQRYDALAERWNCDFRTVQRRCDEALDLITDRFHDHAALATAALDGPNAPSVPNATEVFDAGAWYLERFSAVLLLNRERPEAMEERTLVSTTDGLARLGVAFAVPRHPRENRPLGVDMDILYGARLDSVQHPSENMFVQYLTLPHPLQYGERHTYVRTVRIPPGQLMVPRFIHLPLHRCDLFELRVKFNPDALPRAVWVVSKVPEMVYTNQGPPTEDRVEPDSLGEVHVRFTDLRLGFGYGVAWLPASGDHE